MGKTVDVKAIRVYLSELNKNINSTTERGEQPKVYAKLIKREKTGESEIELFFIGTEKDRHIEDLSYSESDPKTWKSWGEIVISPEDALNLAAFLSASVTLAKLKKPKEGDETVGWKVFSEASSWNREVQEGGRSGKAQET